MNGGRSVEDEKPGDEDGRRQITTEELRRRAERLIAEGRMPSFEALLGAMRQAAAEIAQEQAEKAKRGG
jgi:hypothetical protein